MGEQNHRPIHVGVAVENLFFFLFATATAAAAAAALSLSLSVCVSFTREVLTESGQSPLVCRAANIVNNSTATRRRLPLYHPLTHQSELNSTTIILIASISLITAIEEENAFTSAPTFRKRMGRQGIRFTHHALQKG